MRKLIITFLFLLLPTLVYAEIYPIKSVTKVQDGDSFSCLIEFTPFKITLEIDVRVDGINTPEMRGKDIKERELAIRARDYTKNFLERDHLFIDVKKKEIGIVL